MEYACGLAGLVLVTANPSFQVSELKYVVEQSGAVGLFMVDGFRGNPMAEIAQEATSGNTHLREVVKLEDEHALYVFGERPANLPDVQPDDAAQIQYTFGNDRISQRRSPQPQEPREQRANQSRSPGPVSYTHLTLSTNRDV